MNTLSLPSDVYPTDVVVSRDGLRVVFSDGFRAILPLSYSPRLLAASTAARQKWEWVGQRRGIHWPEVDEDLSIAGIVRDAETERASRMNKMPILIADLYRTTQKLNALSEGRPFTPDGHLVGSIGEVVAEYIYDLILEPCSTPHIDAHTRRGQSVQIKLTGRDSYAFQYENEYTAQNLICLRLSETGFEEAYAGRFPTELFAGKQKGKNGQVVIRLSALKANNPSSIEQVRSLNQFNRLFEGKVPSAA